MKNKPLSDQESAREIDLPILTDEMAQDVGLSNIVTAVICDKASTVAFCFASNDKYIVDLEYLRKWYNFGPHASGELRDKSSAEVDPDGDVVTLSLMDGSVYHVVWDVVLMSCEPRYQHFGGFTEYSKSLAKEWSQR